MNKPKPHEIIAIFRDGKQVTYTTSVFTLLITDNDVIAIYDKESSALLHYKN